ncbi:MAG: leucine-rich repeat protein [Butyrivibrio sp.]|nr:leucine-rich repeat protein [Butyrivibrio sp.]
MDEKQQFLNEYNEDYPEELTDAYELLECISAGTLGETLLAVERESGRRAVVKCYMREHPFFADSEPQSIKELCFRGIPAYITEFKNGAMRCVVREYIEGESLEKMGGKLSERQICRIGIQLSGILEYIHSRRPPVIHRDIKPQNVIIQKDGGIALIDFGISRCYSDGSTSDTTYGGTYRFAPPEQYGFAQTDSRSDIYSMGILLTWLYSGSAEPIRKPASDFEKILAKSTAFLPRSRFCSAGSLKKRLERVLYAERRQKRVIALETAATALLAVAVAVLSARSFGDRKEGQTGDKPAPGGTYAEKITAQSNLYPTAATASDGSGLTGTVSGSCGDNAVYVLDFDTDTLTISGEGMTYHYYMDGIDSFYDDPNYRNERPPWRAYMGEFDRLVVEPGITGLGNNSFAGCLGLKEIELNGTESVGTNCFNNCGLTKVTLSEGVKHISAWAFARNPELEEAEFPKSLEDLGNASFAGCPSLKRVIFHGPTAIWTLYGNENSVLADDSGNTESEDAVFYCLSYGGAVIHAKEFGIPYIIIDE